MGRLCVVRVALGGAKGSPKGHQRLADGSLEARRWVVCVVVGRQRVAKGSPKSRRCVVGGSSLGRLCLSGWPLAAPKDHQKVVDGSLEDRRWVVCVSGLALAAPKGRQSVAKGSVGRLCFSGCPSAAPKGRQRVAKGSPMGRWRLVGGSFVFLRVALGGAKGSPKAR